MKILLLFVLPLVVLMIPVVYGQEENTTEHVPEFFAIQHAQSGLISEINKTAYSLELNNVADTTILFSDRPDRIVTTVSTSDFIGNWSVGENSYAINPPNAVLMVDESEKQDIAIIELFNPIYDNDKKVLKYEATLDNSTSVDLSREFGQSTIVIDDSRPILKPMPLIQ